MTVKKLVLTTAVVLVAIFVGGLAYCTAGTGPAVSQDDARGAGPAAQAEPRPAKGKQDNLIRGFVEALEATADGKAVRLRGGRVVPVDGRTEYLIETGLDAMPAKLGDVLGKAVYIVPRQEAGRTVARVVAVVFPQPEARPPAPAAAKADTTDRLRGVVRAFNIRGSGLGSNLLLTSGASVPIDKQTKYLIETGDDVKRGTVDDTVGKEVLIFMKGQGRNRVATTVEVLWPQVRGAMPPEGRRPGVPAEAPIAWGQPEGGLRVGIGRDGSARTGKVRLALALENLGNTDVVFNLGTMLNNGKRQYPSALRLLLTDAGGGRHRFQQTPRAVAGRTDPFLVPLPAGGRYTLRFDLDDFREQDGPRVGRPLAPGRYDATLQFVGKAVTREQTNADTTGLALMPWWTGTVRSGTVRLAVLPDKGGGSAAHFEEVRWVPPKGPNRGLLYVVLTEPRAEGRQLDLLVVRYAGAALRVAAEYPPGDDRKVGSKGVKDEDRGFNVVFAIRATPGATSAAVSGFSLEQLRQIRDADLESARRLASVHAWSHGKIGAAP